MAKVINDTDQLTFILTQYGLSRVAEALSNPNEDLKLSKIKVGDANFEYYTPTESQTALVNPIPNGEFYIIEKELLEDNLTVSLHAVFPETFQNVEIREVGIYETIDDVDYLFAISTQQPLLKPYINLNYLISVDYFAFLKSQNLAEVYDQIVLDPNTQLVTEEDLEKLMSTILFTESNLMEQINGNTRAIGLGRVEQLQARVNQDRANFGYLASYNNYTNLLDLTNNSKVFGYWLFNYPRRVAISNSVIDIGTNGYNFSTNTNINTFERIYKGTMPMLKISSPNYFYLEGSTPNLDFYNTDTLEDYSLTFAFALQPINQSIDRTLIARSNYSNATNVFEINERANGSLEIKLFSDANNYITFVSNANAVPEGAHSVVLSYDSSDKTMKSYIGGQKVDLTRVETGVFTHMNRGTSLPMTSYVINSNGNNAQYIDSYVGMLTIVTELFTEDKLRSVALNLEATMGNNPCIRNT